MSIKSVNDALDFLPERHPALPVSGFIAKVAEFFRSIGSGLAASNHYSELVARGVPADKAVRIVFDEHFKDR